MVDTRTGKSTWPEDYVPPRGRRKKDELGSHPSGDLHVSDEDRAAKISAAIDYLSLQKDRLKGRIFDMMSAEDDVETSFTHWAPPSSPTPGDEEVYESMGELEHSAQLSPASEIPDAARQGQRVDFAQALEWKLGRLDEAVLDYEHHRVRENEPSESPRRRSLQFPAPEPLVLPDPSPGPGPAKQGTHETEVEDPGNEISAPGEVRAEKPEPVLKLKETERAEWQEVGDGAVVQYDGFEPVKNGARVGNRYFKLPTMFSGPSVFPAWFVHYFSGDHSIRVEGWDGAEKESASKRRLIAPPPLSPIVEEPESDNEPEPELTPDSTPEPSITSSSDVEEAEGLASGLDTGTKSEGVADPWVPIPVWGDATAVVAHSAVLETPRVKPVAADADAPVSPTTVKGTETRTPRPDDPLTMSELHYANKVMRVRTYEGLDAAIAFVCNSNPQIEPELAKQWVNYMFDAMNRKASLTPKVMRDFKNGFWPGYGPDPQVTPPSTSTTWPPETPPPGPKHSKRKVTMEEVSDEDEMPYVGKGKGVDPRERSSSVSTPRNVRFTPERTSSPPPYRRVEPLRPVAPVDLPSFDESDWVEESYRAPGARRSPEAVKRMSRAQRARSAPPGGYYSEIGGMSFLAPDEQREEQKEPSDLPNESEDGKKNKTDKQGNKKKHSRRKRRKSRSNSSASGEDQGNKGKHGSDTDAKPPATASGPVGPPRLPPSGPTDPDGDDGSSSSSSSDDKRAKGKRDGRKAGKSGGGGGGGPPGSRWSSSSSSSSSLSSSSSSSSDSQSRAIRERRRLVSQMKIKQPRVYDGRADLDLFDQWCFEVDLWKEMNALDIKWVIPLLSSFLADKAARWYMNNVVLSDEEWTLRRVYDEIFDHCFPTDFKMLLRKKFTHATQGNRNVREFARDLKVLARRFPDVGHRQLVQVFWEGVYRYIRIKWHEYGYNVDENTYDELVDAAEQFERAERVRTGEDRVAKLPDRWTGGRGRQTQETAKPSNGAGSGTTQRRRWNSSKSNNVV
ncbi:hypothetical protein AURDEDRAFT_173897 [Auricularia subglabra TFB-10046 SS5]|nr:hypothetical protein AURDEDRAFT_173897 [Auricularia subglabra TFB-10046 SS5]